MFVAPTIGVYGQDFTATGDLKCNNVKVPNQEIFVGYDFVNSTGPTVLVNTDANGHYSVTFQDVPAKAVFDAEWDGNVTCPNGALADDTPTVYIRVGVIFNADRSSANNGDVIHFSGYVAPDHAFDKVYLMFLHGNENPPRWVPEVTVSMDGNSHYHMSYRKRANVRLWFRVGFPTQDADHLWNWSRVLVI